MLQSLLYLNTDDVLKKVPADDPAHLQLIFVFLSQA
jgi:hypothetical protein